MVSARAPTQTRADGGAVCCNGQAQHRKDISGSHISEARGGEEGSCGGGRARTKPAGKSQAICEAQPAVHGHSRESGDGIHGVMVVAVCLMPCAEGEPCG